MTLTHPTERKLPSRLAQVCSVPPDWASVISVPKRLDPSSPLPPPPQYEPASKKWTRKPGSPDGLVVMFFKCHRGNGTERSVAPRRVVERLDVIEDGKFSLGMGVGLELVQPSVA